MKSKPYSVVGNKRGGHRIAVPECMGAKAGDRYDFRYCEESGDVFLPIGTLIYVPKGE